MAQRHALDFSLPAPRLAPRLIGCMLEANGVRARITETEAYHGTDDQACHAHKGRTPRSELLWREPGTLYCYLCYGVHVLLNIVCDRPERPSAVLIRGVVAESGERLVRDRRRDLAAKIERLTNGPGKVTQALALGLDLNGQQLGQRGCALRLEARPPVARRSSGPRVGIGYAGEPWLSQAWRWWEPGFPVARA